MTILFAIFCIFYLHPENFKIFFITNAILFFILLYIQKKFFFSLYSLFFINLFFLEPGKYYSFELLPGGYVKKEPFFSQGMTDGYGFLASDFLGVGLLLYFLGESLGKNKHFFLEILRLNRFIIGSWGIFLLVIFYSSLFESFFPTFSVVNSFQYGKIVVAFLATFYLLRRHASSGKKLFTQLVAACLLCSFGLSIFQFFSSSLDPNNLGVLSGQLEDQSLFYRPHGLFLHSNEWALFVVFLGSFLLHRTKKTFFLSVGVVGMVLLTQSRTVWLSALLSYLLLFLISSDIRKHSVTYLKKILSWLYQSPLLLLLTLFLTSVILLPRVQATRYTLLAGSGAIRLKMLEDGWMLLQFSPVYGFGANTNVLSLFQYLRESYLQDFPYPIHMGYLQLALEAGTLGAFFFFFPFIYILVRNVIHIVTSFSSRTAMNGYLLIILMLYFIFQPHAGRFELPLLGIIFGYTVYTTEYEKS